MAILSEQELETLKKKIRNVTENELEELQEEAERTNVFPDAYYDVIVKNDLVRLSLPEEYGGLGLNCEQFFAVMEEFSRGPGGMRMNLHCANGLSWRILRDHGPEDLKAEWLPRLADERDFYILFALTEADSGSGADIRTTAVRKGDKYILNGTKTLISHTDIAKAAYVIAVTDETKRKKGGLTAFIVDTNTPGYYTDPMPHMMGCRGAGHADLRFENCEVPAHNILGKEGDGLDIFMEALAHSRAMVAVTCLGLSQRFLELAIKRAEDRVTFGKPLVARQAIQQTIADMGTQVHALRLMLQDCARKFDRGESIEMVSSMCKLHGIDTVRTVSDSCLEIFGGIGYFEDNPYGPVERMYRDARALWFEEGPRTVQRLTIARPLIASGGVIV
ncbi:MULTISPECIES: acyl-CoA dehydrogenase family protein [unclassified Brenneria]|uniref:acyl-CoA dehydrogenase family protein n=1 Tax=unclassified Brenneria TaxID=2634434 RepID=UPI0029C5F068|nr:MULTISPECIES: acyl-CoA dehydrogenase family protein [unclassified Brenneria]MDX5628774.1 acyl-CoA dehydrogenase family protein [Brenneria sp. L3-3Z]MDX5695913.1 acyl-CoA dehydrogenase family protein [Brenneria sp. L4-2C]MEE3661203.1 acyl-CoA dehydrogenase family protein [Brenneria sp. g21c3]